MTVPAPTPTLDGLAVPKRAQERQAPISLPRWRWWGGRPTPCVAAEEPVPYGAMPKAQVEPRSPLPPDVFEALVEAWTRVLLADLRMYPAVAPAVEVGGPTFLSSPRRPSSRRNTRPPRRTSGVSDITVDQVDPVISILYTARRDRTGAASGTAAPRAHPEGARQTGGAPLELHREAGARRGDDLRTTREVDPPPGGAEGHHGSTTS